MARQSPEGALGLSPRVRGNQSIPMLTFTQGGSIPACAGEPMVPARPRNSNGVYPRVCGGTAEKKTQHVVATGLSPRVRGNPSDGP